MQTGSSSPLSLLNKTKKCPSSRTPPPSTSKNAHSRRNGVDKIKDPKKSNTTFSKRSDGLIKKAFALNSLTGASTAVIAYTQEGKFQHFGNPSEEEVIYQYLRYRGDMMLRTRPEEWGWATEAYNSCTTKEDCTSLLVTCLHLAARLLKKRKDLENNPSVNAGAGPESGVGAGRESSGMDSNPTCSSFCFRKLEKYLGLDSE